MNSTRGVRLTPPVEPLRPPAADHLKNGRSDPGAPLAGQGSDGAAYAHGGGRKDRRRGERISLADRWRKVPLVEQARQPTLALLLSRPVLLLVCALLGASIGFALGGQPKYSSSAVVEFTSQTTDSNLVKVSGQTIAGTATSADVVNAAASGLGRAGAGLAGRVSAQWEPDTQLVSVTVKADSASAAVAGANAVAQTLVTQAQAAIEARLQAAFDESNRVLSSRKLSSSEAEIARLTALGSSLGSRQDAIVGQSNALTLSDRATTGTMAGLSRAMTAAIGLVAALLLAGLASLLLGIRGLKASSQPGLHRLLPSLDLRTPSDAAGIAGQLVESGQKCVVVIAAPGVRDAATQFGQDVSFFAQALGMNVAFVGPAAFDEDRQGVDLLSRRRRADVRQSFGVDMVVAVMPGRSDASNLLRGQSDLAAFVVMRRRHTPITVALSLTHHFARARPSVILAG